MERYNNIVKIEKIRKHLEQGEPNSALSIAVTINKNKIKNMSDLSVLAEAYFQNGHYKEAKDIFLTIYERAKSRRILAQLVHLSIKLYDVKDAEHYLEEFIKIAPKDFYRHIFRYSIDKLLDKDISVLIQDLEKLKDDEYMESWAYELAKLYHKAGEKEKCISECSNIILWFGNGVYVDKAKALKAYYLGELDISNLTEKEQREKEKRIAKQIRGILKDQDNNQKDNHYKDDYEDEYEDKYVYSSDKENIEKDQNEILKEVKDQGQNESLKEDIEQGQNEGLRVDVEDDQNKELKEAMVDGQNEDLKEALEDDQNEDLKEVTDGGQNKGQKEDIEEEINAAQIKGERKVLEKDPIHPMQEGTLNLIQEQNEKSVNNQLVDEYITLKKEDLQLEGEEETYRPFSEEPGIKETTGEYNDTKDTQNIDDQDSNINEAKCELVKMENLDNDCLEMERDSKLYCLLEEKKITLEEVFHNFIRMEEVRSQLLSCMKEIIDKEFKQVNLVITGASQSGKTYLAKALSKFMYSTHAQASSKIAIINAEKLNTMDLSNKKEQLQGCTLIIDKAGKLSKESISTLVELANEPNLCTMMVLEDTKEQISGLWIGNEELKKIFYMTIDLPEYKVKHYLGFILDYLKEREYDIDVNAYGEIEKLLSKNLAEKKEYTLESVFSDIHDIVKRAETRSTKQLLMMTQTGKYVESDLMVIRKDDIIECL